MNEPELRSRLREARKAAGLTQAEAAKAMGGRPQSFMSKLESGERQARFDEVVSLARLYEVRLAYFEGVIEMTGNTMQTLRCAIGHGKMIRLQNRPEGGLFSLWLCEWCGDLALHMELRGDIYWFKTAVIDRMGRRELSKGGPPFPTEDPGERTHDNAQAEAAQAEWDGMPEEDRPMKRDDLPW